MMARDEVHFDDWLSQDAIEDYDELCNAIERYVQNYIKWRVIKNDTFICFYIIDIDDIPRLRVSVRINKALCVEVHKGELLLSKTSLSWVLGSENKLTCFSQLDTLLSHYGSDKNEITISHSVDSLACGLTQLCERVKESDEYDSSTVERLMLLTEHFHCCLHHGVDIALMLLLLPFI
jgi:hypothetical protein